MTPKQELQLLEEIEALNKTYIFFTHNEKEVGYFDRGKGEELLKDKLENEVIEGKRFFNADEVENLLSNVIIVNIVDLSKDGKVSAPIPDIETLKNCEKPINIINLGNGINLSCPND